MKHEPRQGVSMEKPLETAWVGSQIGWGGISGYHHDWVNNVSQVDRDSDMVPTCWLSQERAQKRNNGLCQPFQEKAALPALTLMPDNSVPPHISLVPFKLLPPCWSSEQVTVSKSLCVGPLRETQPSVSLSHNPCWFIQQEVMGASLPSTETLGWRPGLGLAPSLLRGDLHSQDIPLNFYLSHACGTSLF